MKAWEVDDGIDGNYCETEEIAKAFADERRRQLAVIGYQNVLITIKEVEITSIPENERRYVADLLWIAGLRKKDSNAT